MSTLWRFITRTVLWDYDRGTVPYDVMVLAIVLFVFVSPRAWFSDRPRLTTGDHADTVEVVSDDRTAGIRVYRIDAHLLAPSDPVQLERRTHDFLGKNVESLRGRNFRIENVKEHRSENGAVYYDVAVKQ